MFATTNQHIKNLMVITFTCKNFWFLYQLEKKLIYALKYFEFVKLNTKLSYTKLFYLHLLQYNTN